MAKQHCEYVYMSANFFFYYISSHKFCVFACSVATLRKFTLWSLYNITKKKLKRKKERNKNRKKERKSERF